MKKRHILIIAAMSLSFAATAQRTPDHNFDFETIHTDTGDVRLSWDNFHQFFDSWQAGTPPEGLSKIDDEFFISRQRPLPRITDGDYHIHASVPTGRKMLLWTPLDDPTTTWKALPRYCFEGDNFSMWSYINCHGNWSAPWLRVSAGLSDAAAKNGVTVGCVLAVPWDADLSLTKTDRYSLTFKTLTEKDEKGKFKNSLKLAKLMKYYGINGLGVNSEFGSNPSTMAVIQEFFADMHKKAESIGWKFELQWYDVTNDEGDVAADKGINRYNQKMFGTGSNIVTDQLFANYDWSDYLLQASTKNAKALKRDPYDYYAGFDIQGRALKNNYWQALIDNETSVGFWGAHSESLIHQSATDDGTSDMAIQKAYQLKQEMIFSGGYRNPGLLPEVRTDCSLSNTDLKTFHGLARLLTAKSTIQNVPFVTRFNLGNGLKFYKEGKVAFDSKWYNLNLQDYLPTWRFWITDRSDKVTAASIQSLAKAELSWDEVYTGGSSLRLYGATDFSRIKLFKTMLTTQPSYELSVTYKLKSGNESHAKLFVALKNDVNNYKEIDIPAAKQGEWTTFTTPLSKLGLQANDVVAMIGVALENTDANYQMNIGELALRNPEQSFATIQPKIKEIEVLRGWYNSVDFKMRYASKEETGDEKTYNDEVGTWYYEIYFQQKGEEAKLLTATESWAAYVVGAPLVANGERMCRFGVRAVSPDGKQGSDIAWSEYQQVEYNAHKSSLAIDHSIIKPNEEFTVGYEDNLMPAAKEWKIVDAADGNIVATAKDATAITTKLDKEGVYDVITTDAEGKETATRGFIKITPEATGAMPKLYSLSANKAKINAGENVDYTYSSRKADGKVSRAVVISDPEMLSIPAATQQSTAFSIAMWFKADKWSHDKDGTQLISKNSIYDSWPRNNWGDIWVLVRPEITDETTGTTHPANEISFNTLSNGNTTADEGEMITYGYSILPNVWTHLVVTQDEQKVQKIYINGKCVAGPYHIYSSTRREELGKLDLRIDTTKVANIYVGGGGTYKSAFDGAIDEVQVWNKALTDNEVQQAMKGYAEGKAPEGLQAYYTFEETDDKGMFPNHGALKECAASMVKVADASGENTNMAQYVQLPANTNEIGYPGITGSILVNTKAEWQLGAANDASIIKEEGNVATISYTQGGTKDVKLTLSNAWGVDSISKAGIVEVDGSSSIDDIHANDLAITPYAKSVNFRFAESAHYSILIISPAGILMQRAEIDAHEGQLVNVALHDGNVAYIVQVMKDNKVYKSVKVACR